MSPTCPYCSAAAPAAGLAGLRARRAETVRAQGDAPWGQPAACRRYRWCLGHAGFRLSIQLIDLDAVTLFNYFAFQLHRLCKRAVLGAKFVRHEQDAL